MRELIRGNFTAALGVPTPDGMGVVCEGAHAANESILIERMVGRAALIAKMLAEMGREQRARGALYSAKNL